MRAGWVVAMAAMAAVAGAGPAVASDRMTLEEANRRWSGARCRSGIEITLSDKRPKDGWERSLWIFRTPEGGNERVRVLLTGGDRIRRRYLGGTLPVGSEFVAVGWNTEKPEGRGTLFLELEHIELGARARVYYMKDWVGNVEVDDLAEFEQWARLTMFEILESPGESLVEVGSGSAAEGDPAAAGPPPVGPVELRVLGAGTEPLSVAPGETVVLTVTYEVSGPPAGRSVEVLERRAVLRDGRVLTTLEATVLRGPGLHRSSQSLTVPASIQPGVLELRASVGAAGSESSGEALFRVR